MMHQTDDTHQESGAGRVFLTDFYGNKTVAHTKQAMGFASGWRKALLRDLVDRNLVRDALHARMDAFVGLRVTEAKPTPKRRKGAA